MSEAIKPTPGEWLVVAKTFVYALNEDGYNRFDAQLQPGNIARAGRTSVEELAANAALIADAGNAYNTTGLTPRQLVERVKELEEALRDAVDCGMVPKSSAADGGASKYSAQVLVADRIRAALSKALPNADAKEAGK